MKSVENYQQITPESTHVTAQMDSKMNTEIPAPVSSWKVWAIRMGAILLAVKAAS